MARYSYLLMLLLFCLEPNNPCIITTGSIAAFLCIFRGVWRVYARLRPRVKRMADTWRLRKSLQASIPSSKFSKDGRQCAHYCTHTVNILCLNRKTIRITKGQVQSHGPIP